MHYELRNFENLLGTEGFSDQQLATHFKLYQGYVENINKILELKFRDSEEKIYFDELSRRQGWEWNGMRLHELCFDNLTKARVTTDHDSGFYRKVLSQYGSFEAWETDFKKLSKMRGIGWVVCYYDQKADRIINTWVNEHDQGHLAGLVPLLVLDVFEHAYMIDYKTDKTSYVEVFWNAVNWEVVEGRYEQVAESVQA